VRIREPRREGQKIEFEIRDDSLPLTHPARLIWEALGLLDLSPFMAGAKAVEGGPGGTVKSRRLLIALWCYGLSQGIDSAREIASRLLPDSTDLAFRWLAGDMYVSHTLLSEFMVEHLDALQALFTNVLQVLKREGLIFRPGDRVAQDGTRMRADAGTASFRQRDALEQAREQAELQLKAILARTDDPPLTERQQQARERGAMDVLDRTGEAIQVVQELQEKRSNSSNKKRQTTKPKASTTDPEARIMKVPNGGFEPSFNVQLAVMGSPMGGPVTILGVQVTNLGSDKHSILPMCEQVEQRTGQTLDAVLLDAEHLTHEEVRAASEREHPLMLIAPVPEHWKGSDAPQDPAVVAWIAQTQTEPMRYAYRARKSLVERANAILKERLGVRRAPVRGVRKVLCFFLLVGVVANLLQHGLKLLT
jgi:transposase